MKLTRTLRDYDRKKAADYALKWALVKGGNPNYKDYSTIGGDCTNFISQCLRAGNIPFDHKGVDVRYNWYWYSDYSRTPSFTSADDFQFYLLNNNRDDGINITHGIFARKASYEEMDIGDIVQLEKDNGPYHTMIVTRKHLLKDGSISELYICQRTADLRDYPLSYKQGIKSYIKILGYYI